ncbi:MAG TPA: glutamate carboxypeptidase, partial [Telluria sp.]|nr:glutamate carboxypeptidase [Telluria sp.]
MKKRLISLLAAVVCAAPAVSFAQAVHADRALLQAAQARKDALVKDMATLINIDSGTDDAKGLAQVEAMLAQRLKDVGASVEIVAAPPAAGKMVVGKLQGTGSKNIMLMIHYDTVFGTGEAAKR